jgi:hypothetical protein
MASIRENLVTLVIMLVRLATAALVLTLAACAAAVPGYIPPPFKEKSKMGKALESGDVASDGRYQIGKDEKTMDCRRLTGSMQITISRLRDWQTRPTPSGLASTAHKTVGPVIGGSTVGADRQADYARERAKLDAYNRELAAKSCKTLDIDAELKRAPDAPGKKY